MKKLILLFLLLAGTTIADDRIQSMNSYEIAFKHVSGTFICSGVPHGSCSE